MRCYNYVLMLLMSSLIVMSCRESATKTISENDIEIKSYKDSINSLVLNLQLPKNLSIYETIKILEVVYNLDSVDTIIKVDKILKEKRNLISSLIVKDVNDKFMTIKLQNESWINEGDTLVTVDYITYLRHYNRRLLIDDMITNTNELDSITQMILKKSNLKIFSPNGNIAILGDSILFYYNNMKQEDFKVAFSVENIKTQFKKFNTIYNE